MHKWTSPRLSSVLGGDEEASRALIPVARNCVGYLFDQLSPGQKYKTQSWFLYDGSVITAYVWNDLLGKRASVHITAPGRAQNPTFYMPFFSLVWLPRGLCVTPKSAEAPHGYGFPKRDRFTGERIEPPYGTKIGSKEDEALNQVLFNKFENNCYLDAPSFIKGEQVPGFDWPDNPRLRPTAESELPDIELSPYRHGAFGYNPTLYPLFDPSFWDYTNEQRFNFIDEPGFNMYVSRDGYFIPYKVETTQGGMVPSFRQMTPDESGFNSAFYEEESTQWFAHWPEELLYENKAYEEVFQGSNLLRDAVGKKPVTRPIRGFANGADLTTIEMTILGEMHHESDAFRSGYGTLMGRITAMGNNARLAGENLAMGTALGSVDDKATGTDLVSGWEHSPGHYANIISDHWSQPPGATALNVGGGYGSPRAGQSYAQWFEKRERWIHGGLFSNDTPFGPVSVRSINSFVMSRFSYSGYDECSIYFLGREFIISQIVDTFVDNDTVGNMILLGATAFIKDNKVWMRAVTFDAGEKPRFVSYSCPISNADKEARWKEEASMAIEFTAGYITSGFTFSYDGKKGVGGLALLGEVVAESYFGNKNEPARKAMAIYDVMFDGSSSSPTLSISQKKHLPGIKFEVQTETYENTVSLTSYSQEVKGSAALHSFYVGDEIKSLVYNVDMRAYQHTARDAEFHCFDSIVFPSGKEMVIVNQRLVNGIPLGDCFITSFLYIDPRTENCVYAKINLRRESNIIYGQLQFFYNEILLKEYPEQIIANHYTETEDEKISGEWAIEYDPEVPRYAAYAYDISYLRSNDAYGNVYPLPYPFSMPRRSYCEGNPDIVLRLGSIRTGNYVVSAGRRQTCAMGCYSEDTAVGEEFLWSYEMAIPSAGTGGDITRGDDDVYCEFVQYQDRVAIDILFKGICKITADNPEGEHIIYANFDIEGELDMGKITSLMPLGVV